ncbi:hypothetical protein KDW_01440 [Dictyobacter vulcani]|uniref:Uncharacterized protein n=1 Tax=Dictyobacter vulcani TaxID=2607529 RepID=A0A5J4KGV4_9CHLR|nr:hypothetical protein KDW_01440 [Dictyobacter vulcani]
MTYLNYIIIYIIYVSVKGFVVVSLSVHDKVLKCYGIGHKFLANSNIAFTMAYY